MRYSPRREKTACETDYSGAPTAGKYAVEYVPSYCASKAVKQGHTVINKPLLTLDLSIPKASTGKQWTFEYLQNHIKKIS